MKLYHGSNVEVANPDLSHSRPDIDFGKGFYLTSMREQAEKYTARFSRRGQDAYLNIYDFADNLEEWKIKVFDAYDDEWLDFVAANRSGSETEPYDLVVGGIANDRVIDTLDLYFQGIYTREQALGLLVYEKPNIQYCIKSEAMIEKCLRFIESVRL